MFSQPVLVKYGKVWAYVLPRMPLNYVVIDPTGVNYILRANFEKPIKVGSPFSLLNVRKLQPLMKKAFVNRRDLISWSTCILFLVVASIRTALTGSNRGKTLQYSTRPC